MVSGFCKGQHWCSECEQALAADDEDDDVVFVSETKAAVNLEPVKVKIEPGLEAAAATATDKASASSSATAAAATVTTGGLSFIRDTQKIAQRVRQASSGEQVCCWCLSARWSVPCTTAVATALMFSGRLW